MFSPPLIRSFCAALVLVLGAAVLSSGTADVREERFPIRVSRTGFVDAGGKPFEWRGITAFRLAEMISAGREAQAAAYLDWAASQGVTVVRVLLMAKHLFELSPEQGRAALPRLLDLAKTRGLAVEVVALADTKSYTFDYEAHVRAVGRVASAKGNAFVEIANEPGHETQDERVHRPGFVAKLATLVPEPVLVAFGSIEYSEGFGEGDYVTTHVPRGAAWEHVLAVAEGAKRVQQFRKPVVSDEPIGAGPKYQEGRRDNEPARFAAAAALTTLAGMEATFHYEGGLHARIPQRAEAACLDAWRKGLALVRVAEPTGEFLEGDAVSRIARISGARAAFARADERRTTLVLIDPTNPAVQWADGWTELRRTEQLGVAVITAERRSP